MDSVSLRHHVLCEKRGMPHVPPPAGVLVIEDNAGIRKMLAAFFDQQQIPCWLASGGREGVTIFGQHRQRVGVVLCDVQMSDWDGPKTLEEIRRLDPSVPFCFMTGDSGSYSIQDLLALGASRVFKKPFESLASLGNAVCRFLENES